MTSRQSTHSHDCWSWGPAHYECAVRKIETLTSKLQQTINKLNAAQVEIARLQDALLDAKALIDTGSWYSATAGSAVEKALAGGEE